MDKQVRLEDSIGEYYDFLLNQYGLDYATYKALPSEDKDTLMSEYMECSKNECGCTCK